MLHDRLECGILDKHVEHQSLQKATLTYEQALDMALFAEAAAKDVKHL